jgi:hypothetical protein
MSDPKDPKSRILARRAKFMMATFAATLSTACSSTEATSEPCLEPLYDGGSDTADTGTPEPCLGTPYEDSGAPEVCLSAPLDSGSSEGGEVDAEQPDAADAEPTPCLKVAPDSGFDGGAD